MTDELKLILKNVLATIGISVCATIIVAAKSYSFFTRIAINCVIFVVMLLLIRYVLFSLYSFVSNNRINHRVLQVFIAWAFVTQLINILLIGFFL